MPPFFLSFNHQYLPLSFPLSPLPFYFLYLSFYLSLTNYLKQYLIFSFIHFFFLITSNFFSPPPSLLYFFIYFFSPSIYLFSTLSLSLLFSIILSFPPSLSISFYLSFKNESIIKSLFVVSSTFNLPSTFLIDF